MREIKFRVWDNNKKYFIPFNEMDIKMNLSPEDKPNLWHLIFENGVFRNMVDNVYVYGDIELNQFTGLKDKNGKECFEGDIIDGRYGKDTVRWHENICGFVPFAYGSNAPSEEEFEIIGNIYENEELLK